MAPENASGESRFSSYVNSIISSHCISLGQPVDIDVPAEAEYLSLEGDGNRRILTFYRNMSRPDLVKVPPGWKTRPQRFEL